MTLTARLRPAPAGRPMVLLLYGSLAAQIFEFGAYSLAHLPRLVNVFQFVAICGQFLGWIGLHTVTQQLVDRYRPDEREIALRDRTGWICFRILGATMVAATTGYLIFHDGLGWLPAPGPVTLSLLAYCVFVVTMTLPSAVLAWTHLSPPLVGEDA